jgi:hypothetical protein
MVPDTAKAGEPILIILQLLVWGGRREYQGTAHQHQAILSPGGGGPLSGASPAAVSSRRGKSEFHVFVIPPFPKGASGEIEFYFELLFDGHPNKIPGTKRILLTAE